MTKPFVKGDARINRKGRPKTFDKARELAQAIAHEVITKSGGEQVEINGHLVTVVEAIMRDWAKSGDARLQMAFMEYAFGKPPTRTEVTGANGGAITIDNTEQIRSELLRKLKSVDVIVEKTEETPKQPDHE